MVKWAYSLFTADATPTRKHMDTNMGLLYCVADARGAESRHEASVTKRADIHTEVDSAWAVITERLLDWRNEIHINKALFDLQRSWGIDWSSMWSVSFCVQKWSAAWWAEERGSQGEKNLGPVCLCCRHHGLRGQQVATVLRGTASPSGCCATSPHQDKWSVWSLARGEGGSEHTHKRSKKFGFLNRCVPCSLADWTANTNIGTVSLSKLFRPSQNKMHSVLNMSHINYIYVQLTVKYNLGCTASKTSLFDHLASCLWEELMPVISHFHLWALFPIEPQNDVSRT